MTTPTTTRRYTFERFNLEVTTALKLSYIDLVILADLIDLRDAGGESIQVDGQAYVWCHVPSRIERLPGLAFRGSGRELAPRTVENLYRDTIVYMEKLGLITRHIAHIKGYNGAAIRGTYLYIRINPEIETLFSKREPLSDEEKARLVPTGQDCPVAPSPDHCAHTRNDIDQSVDTRTGDASLDRGTPEASLNTGSPKASLPEGTGAPHIQGGGVPKYGQAKRLPEESLPEGRLSEGLLLGSSTGEGVVSLDTPPIISDEGKDMEIPPSLSTLILPTSPVLVPDPVVPPQYPVASVRPPRPQPETDKETIDMSRHAVSRSMMPYLSESSGAYPRLRMGRRPDDVDHYDYAVLALAHRYGVITLHDFEADKEAFEEWFFRVGPEWLDKPRYKDLLTDALHEACDQGIQEDRLAEAVEAVPVNSDAEILTGLLRWLRDYGSASLCRSTVSLPHLVELWTGAPLPDALREELLTTDAYLKVDRSGHIIADSDRGRPILSMARELGYPMYREIKPGDIPRPARKQTSEDDNEEQQPIIDID